MLEKFCSKIEKQKDTELNDLFMISRELPNTTIARNFFTQEGEELSLVMFVCLRKVHFMCSEYKVYCACRKST